VNRLQLRRAWCALVLAIPLTVTAATNGKLEARLIVSGRITVDVHGNVSSYTLDNPEKLPDGIDSLVRQTSQTWRFSPVIVDGVVQNVQARMSLTLVAQKIDGNLQLRLDQATFSSEKSNLKGVGSKRVPPRYPEVAVRYRTAANTYVAVHVAADGHVIEAFTEQVNFKNDVDPVNRELLRNAFAKASEQAAAQWTFDPPASKPTSADGSWTIEVPIGFNLSVNGQDTNPEHNGWQSYLAGAKTTPPWLHAQNDALPQGGLYVIDAGQILNDPPPT
jgi:hypothetical protein